MPPISVSTYSVGSRMTWVARLSRLNVEVAPQQVAADLAVAEHPELGQEEVAEGRDLRREDRRPEELVLAHGQDEGVQRDLVDEDPEIPTSANFEGLRRDRKRRRTRGRRCQRVALWAFGSGCVTDPSVRRGSAAS